MKIVLASLLVAFWVQASPPIRLGPTSDKLTGEDLDQIEAIARQQGGRTWLVLGRSLSGVARPSVPWEVWAFLEPTATSGPVRRGVLLRLVTQLPAPGAFASARSWGVSASSEWAQVSVPGAAADKFENSRDVNRPFSVNGGLTDAILQEVVGVVRSSPGLDRSTPASGSQTASPLVTQVQGSWPILAIRLQPDASVEITLVRDSDELSGQRVVLRKTGTRWVVASVSFWIV